MPIMARFSEMPMAETSDFFILLVCSKNLGLDSTYKSGDRLNPLRLTPSA